MTPLGKATAIARGSNALPLAVVGWTAETAGELEDVFHPFRRTLRIAIEADRFDRGEHYGLHDVSTFQAECR